MYGSSLELDKCFQHLEWLLQLQSCPHTHELSIIPPVNRTVEVIPFSNCISVHINDKLQDSVFVDVYLPNARGPGPIRRVQYVGESDLIWQRISFDPFAKIVHHHQIILVFILGLRKKAQLHR
ncbi:hypothetical protein J6590_051625 [Homalodisca vitripennis]|nr:hypothetical protein J6590_051625 [Homalodisca vitripennis]